MEPNGTNGFLRPILTFIANAPLTQLHPDWIDKAKKLLINGSNEEIHSFFEDIYNLDDSNASRFVRAVVNPYYTKYYT